MNDAQLKSELTLFDATNLVVGSIIGADIYVASAFGAGLLGPFSLVVWLAAGVMAIVIALCFAQCAALLPKVGGPYAYAHDAWGPLPGFVVGWSLWLAEWMSLAAFPLAFTQYLMFFLPGLTVPLQIAVKAGFVLFLIVTNVIGVKTAGRTNDVLTIVKLGPLIFFIVIGVIFAVLNPVAVAGNLTPFLPFGPGNFGTALVLIFWAYAGFEIGTIPAGEIRDPAKTIPRAIVIGIAIVAVFYLTTNMILFAVMPSSQLAASTAPLATATSSILAPLSLIAIGGTAIVGVGALISVAGSDESGMIGTSRLGYALAVDGLFPRVFAKIHPRFKTPYVGIIIQAGTALVAAIIGNLSTIIGTSVFFMAIAYVATSISIFTLRKKYQAKFRLRGGSVVPILGAVFSIYLITQCNLIQIGLGLLLLTVGMPIYFEYTPKKEIAELRQAFFSRENILRRIERREHLFLADLLHHAGKFFRRRKRPSQQS